MTTPTVTSQQRADVIIQWLAEYAQNRINSRLMDERRCVPPYVVMDFGNQGILGMQIPKAYGGLALHHRDYMRVMEQIAAIDLTLGTMVSLNNTLGIRPILNFATQEIKEELLPVLARGRELSSFGMTEPMAGANIGAIATKAIETSDRNGWHISGIKRWNGFAWAGMMTVFARVVDHQGSPRGLTGFVIRQGMPGLKIGPESLTMGLRGIVQNSLMLEQVRVNPSHLIGEVGKGSIPANDAVLFARLSIGYTALGAMKRCGQLMLRYAQRRNVATGSLIKNPVSLAILSQTIASISTIEALLLWVTQQLDNGQSIPREVAIIVKITASEYLCKIADSLVQMLGGRGYMDNNIAPQILRDARVLRLGEGPNESLKIFLGKSIVHESSLQTCLRSQLNEPEILRQLDESVSAMQARSHQLKLNESSARDVWAYSLIGDVAMQGLLLATIQNDPKIEAQQQAQIWAKHQFEQALQQARNYHPAESIWLGETAITEIVTSYDQSISTLEQMLKSENRKLDKLLQQPKTAISVA